MDIELRKEVRAEMVEVRDRLDRLEERLAALEASASPVPTSSKKSAAEPATTEKDSI